MKPIDLLKSLGNVKDTYVISAEEFRQGKQKAQIKRLWILILILILFLILGCYRNVTVT